MFNNQIDASKKDRLFTAARTGNLNLLKSELSAGYLNLRDENSGFTLIETAASAGHAKLVKFLLDKNVLIATDENSNCLSVLHLLLIASDLSNNDEYNSVIAELFNLHIEFGYALFSDPTEGNFANFTLPWLLACKKYYSELSILLEYYLMNNNSNILLLYPNNESIFDLIVNDEQWDIFIRIITNSSIFNANAIYQHNVESEIPYTYLYRLALDKRWDIIELLMEHGYALDFNYTPADRFLSVFDLIASSADTHDLCEKIIVEYEILFCGTEHETEFVVRDDKINELLPERKITPLEKAVKYGSIFWVKYLLEHGATERPLSDALPLEYIAFENEKFEILKYLNSNYRKCSETPKPKDGKFKNISLAWLLVRDDQLSLFYELYRDNLSSVDFDECPVDAIYCGIEVHPLLFYCFYFMEPQKSESIKMILSACPQINFNSIFKKVAIVRNAEPDKKSDKRNGISVDQLKDFDEVDVTPLWLLASQKQFASIHAILDLNIADLDFNYSPEGRYKDTSIAWLLADVSDDDELMKKILALPQKIDFSKHGNIRSEVKISLLEIFVQRQWLHLIIEHPLYQDILPDFFDIVIYFGDINAIKLLKQHGVKPKLNLRTQYNDFQSNYKSTIMNDCKNSPHEQFLRKHPTFDKISFRKHTKKHPPNRVDKFGHGLLFYCLVYNAHSYIDALLNDANITSQQLQVAYLFSPIAHKKLIDQKAVSLIQFSNDAINACGGKRKKSGKIIQIPELSSLIVNNLHYFLPEFSPTTFVATPSNITNVILAYATSPIFILDSFAGIPANESKINLLKSIALTLHNICRDPGALFKENVLQLRAHLIDVYSRYYEDDFSEENQNLLPYHTTKLLIVQLITLMPEIENCISSVSVVDYENDFLSTLNSLRIFSYTTNILNEFIPVFLNIKIKLYDCANDFSENTIAESNITFIKFLSDDAFREMLLAYLNSFQRLFAFYYVYKDDITIIPNNESYENMLIKFYTNTFSLIELMQNCYFDEPLKLCELFIQTQKLIYDGLLELDSSIESNIQKPFDIQLYNTKVSTPPDYPSPEHESSKSTSETDKLQNEKETLLKEKEKLIALKKDEEKERKNFQKKIAEKKHLDQSHNNKKSKPQKPPKALDEVTKKIIADRHAQKIQQENEKKKRIEEECKIAEAKKKAAEEQKQKQLEKQAELKQKKKAEKEIKRQKGNQHRREIAVQRNSQANADTSNSSAKTSESSAGSSSSLSPQTSPETHAEIESPRVVDVIPNNSSTGTSGFSLFSRTPQEHLKTLPPLKPNLKPTEFKEFKLF